MFWLGWFLFFYFAYCYLPVESVQSVLNANVSGAALMGIGTRTIAASGMTLAIYLISGG